MNAHLKYFRWDLGKFLEITKEQYFDNQFNEDQHIKIGWFNDPKVKQISSKIIEVSYE